jgi:hypothetical protein
MRRIDLNDDPVAFFAQRARAASTLDDLEYLWGRWLDLCRSNGVRPLPAQSQVVLTLLHSQAPYWGPDHMRRVADAVAQAHRACGLPDPTDGQVRSYLAAATRGFAGRGERVKVSAIRRRDALTIARAEPTDHPVLRAAAARQRLALIAGHQHQASLAELAGALVHLGNTGHVALRLRTGRSLLLDGPWTDDAHEAARYLIANRSQAFPDVTRLQEQMDGAADRAGLARLPIEHMGEMSDEEFGWRLDWTWHRYAHDLRDRTMIVVGVALARRGKELTKFNIPDFAHAPRSHSWTVRIIGSKSDLRMQGLTHRLDHDHEDGTDWCPACSLALWLDTLQRRWNLTSGPVFPRLGHTPTRTPTGRLTTSEVAGIFRKAWANAGLDDDARIASRSVRVGGATDAHLEGLSAEEIAAERTLHACVDSTTPYIRTNRSVDAILCLDV